MGGRECPSCKHCKALYKIQTPKRYKIGVALHLEKKTGVLLRTLQKGGAEVSASSCNPLTTDNDISAALSEEMDIHAWANQTNEEYYECLNNVMMSQPRVLIDDV